MKNLSEEILSELECETVFRIPFLNNIQIKESVVVSWIIMLIVLIVCITLTRNFKIESPSKRQLFCENAITKLKTAFENILGSEAKEYTEFILSIIIFISIMNVTGIFGFKPPTKDLNVTVGLSIVSILLVEYCGIRKKGIKQWLKSFAEPMTIIAPINILELFIRPLSLCMRLFGNVIGAFVVMKLIETFAPVGIPPIFSLYFDIFDGLIQAYVFTFLTSLFIKEAVE